LILKGERGEIFQENAPDWKKRVWDDLKAENFIETDPLVVNKKLGGNRRRVSKKKHPLGQHQ